MKKLQLIVLSLMMVCTFQANAQYHLDALRYSQTNWLDGSSARMQGIAGAQTSLGGDISLAGSNPAGLGFYNKSSAVFSLGMDFQNSDDTFGLGDERFTTPNFNNEFGVRSAGMVLNYNKGRYTEEKFKGGSLGITFSKVNDFNREFRYEGASGTSIIDDVLENLNNGTDSYLEDAFYGQFLVDEIYYTDPSGTQYFSESPEGVISPSQSGEFVEWASPIGSLPYQQERISQRGGQHQVNFSWGGNYDDRLYFGGGLGFQTLYFERTRNFIEDDFRYQDGRDRYLNALELQDRLVARGGGVNLSTGLIFRPIQQITLGVSYQSPTYLTINEEYTLDLETDFEDFGYEDLNNDGNVYDLRAQDKSFSPVIESRYKIKTPARMNLGATVFLGKAGFISGDIEMVDYANAELQSQDFSALEDNQLIQDFESVVNYRLGAEFRKDNFRFRGGLGLNQDPSGLDNHRAISTLGFGYKSSDYSVDLAIVNTKYKEQYQPYSFEFADFENPVVDSDFKNTTVTISAGFSF